MKLNKLHIFLGALVLFFVFLYLPAPKADLSALKNPPAGGPENLPPPQIEAKSALAEDLLTGEVLFSKNSDEILPLASLTKILSGLVSRSGQKGFTLAEMLYYLVGLILLGIT